MTKILLVEDEMVIALSASFVLEAEGYEVVLAFNGKEGLAALKRETPDLIITDYMMPRMDGVEMVLKLRQDGITTPVVLATSVPRERLPRLTSADYQGFLSKPYHDDDLLDIVRSLLAVDDVQRESR